MDKVYKSKVAKWYVWFCISMTIAFLGSIYLCYESTWVLLIDVVFMGIGLFMMYDMLLHTDYTIYNPQNEMLQENKSKRMF